jgi:hypothetical protein
MKRPDKLMQYTEIIGDFPENDKITNSLCRNNIKAGKPDYCLFMALIQHGVWRISVCNINVCTSDVCRARFNTLPYVSVSRLPGNMWRRAN